jgi:uncharacterized UPF0160 family protein
MADKIKVVTHSSKFHTDDIFAVATLTILLGEANVEVIRSRDAEIIQRGDYVVDVGGIYDSEKNRFDHHQTGGAGERENGVRYSSFGLVWKKFGEKICGSSEIADKIDQRIVQPIDADDNGMNYIDTKIQNLYPFDVQSIVRAFRPTWKEEEDFDAVFKTLVLWAMTFLERQVKFLKDSVEAEILVEESYNKAEDKRLILIENGVKGGEVLKKFPEPLFIIYQPNGSYKEWSLVTVETDIPFKSRKDLPASWAGKMDEELEQVSGVNGAVFCHNNRFIAVAKTKEAILKMAEIALNS